MTRIKNWKINVSIGLVILGLFSALLEVLIEAIEYSDSAITLGMIIGFLLGTYFTVYIPIRVLHQYKRDNNGMQTKKTK